MSHRYVTPDPLLDAARASVMAVGVRRTTMSDVARRARISRQTAYRRHPDVASLLSALMTREFGRVIEAAAAHAAPLASGRARVVEQTVRGAQLLASEPLFGRILDVDPELLLPYVVERLGEIQQTVIVGLGTAIEEGVEDGSVRQERPGVLAAGVELIARGFVLSAHVDRDEELDQWAELRIALDGYLRSPAP